MTRKTITSQPFVKFLIVGGGATAFNYCVFLFFYSYLAFRYEIAFILGFLAGILFGYFFNFFWTFRDSSISHEYNLWRYFCTYMASLLTGIAALQLAVKLGGFDPRLANLATIFLTTFINYFGLRNWVFKNESES